VISLESSTDTEFPGVPKQNISGIKFLEVEIHEISKYLKGAPESEWKSKIIISLTKNKRVKK